MRLRVRGCRDCLDKAVQIDALKAEVARLRKQNARLRQALGQEHRLATEPPFGSSTSSAKLPLKPTSPAERQAKRGGARPGHRGHGRRMRSPTDTVTLPPHDCCPDCGGPLGGHAERTRILLDAEPLRVSARRYRFTRQRCRRCGKTVTPVVPGALPKALLGNRLTALVATEHYLHGMPMGQLATRLKVGEGALFHAMHQLAHRLAAVPARLAETLRQAPCKHADETPWRIDGANGYAWFFGNADTSLFRFGLSRAGSVVTAVLGAQPLPGTLVVDRYAGYHRSPCARQFCYAHLLRDLKDLASACPDSREVATFVATLAPRLAAAMHLPGQNLADADYYALANDLRRDILAAIDHPARHLAVQGYQSIFRQHRQHLFRWVDDRRIPPDNNFAERALRPTVIARKLSFGSQSPIGAQTREVLMTTVQTLAKRVADPLAALTQALDALRQSPTANLADLLFPSPTGLG